MSVDGNVLEEVYHDRVFQSCNQSFYSAMRKRGGIRHILARRWKVLRAAEGHYPRNGGVLGVCLGNYRSCGHGHDHALYSRFCCDSIHSGITGGLRPSLHKKKIFRP